MTYTNSRIAMGQAYKHITDLMGPSHQLVAFVNFDQVTQGDLGLESLSISKDHEQILEDIKEQEYQAVQYDDSYLSDPVSLEQDGLSMFDLGSEIDQLSDIGTVIQSHGMNTSSFGIMRATHLLSGTSLAAIALEDFSARSDEDQTEMALESILSTIKEKVVAWSARALNFIKKLSDISFKDVQDKISSIFTRLIAKVSDVKTDLTKKVKAHPYASAIAAVTAITASAAVITYIGQKIAASNAANNDEIEKIIAESEKIWEKYVATDGYLSKGHTPGYVSKKDPRLGGEIAYRYFMARRALAFQGLDPREIPATPEPGTWQELGWTKSSIVALSNKMKPLFDQVSHALTTFVSGMKSLITNAKDSAATEAFAIPGMSKRLSYQVVTSIYWAVYRLIKKKVGPGFHHLAAILLRLMGH